jgi:hypothetical protein
MFQLHGDESGSLGNRCSIKLSYGAKTQKDAKQGKNRHQLHTCYTPETSGEGLCSALGPVAELPARAVRVTTPGDRLREAIAHIRAAQRLAYNGLATEIDPDVVGSLMRGLATCEAMVARLGGAS